MLKKIKRWLDKGAGNHHSCLQWNRGKWYVRYKDGERSVTMHYSTACDYANIFGGTVYHINDIEGA